MKKIFIIAALLTLCNNIFSQTAALTVYNGTDFVLTVTVYGSSASACSGTCTDYATTIVLTAATGLTSYPTYATTFGPSTPCTIAGYPGLSGCSTPWCTSVPSDFQWTYAEVSIGPNPPATTICWATSIFPIAIYGNILHGCSGSASYTVPAVDNTCPGTTYPNLRTWWSSTGGSLADVTINVEQY
jgi:hypothetical protein